MPGFSKNALRDPFGGNNFLRSTEDVATESRTLSKASVPTETIDGTTQKMIRKGELLAKITSGPEIGKVGPFQRGTSTNEIQLITPTAVTAGTFTITFDGETTAPIAYNAAAAAIQTALEVLDNVEPGDIVVTGGPLSVGVVTLSFGGTRLDTDVPAVTVSTAGMVTNEVQNIAVDATGGTFTVTFEGSATPAQAFNVSAANLQAALRALAGLDSDLGDVTVTGGPGAAGGATPYVLTFGGRHAGQDVPAVTTNAGSLTGGAGTAAVTTALAGGAATGTVVVSTSQAGGAAGGPTDGRQDPANIVGFCNTFLPWQLLERDVEVACVYDANVVQANCFERNAAGVRIALSNETVTNIRALKGLTVAFK